MSNPFFDTCALIPRYCPGKHTYRVNKVFSGAESVFIAEISMVEVPSALAAICKDRGFRVAQFEKMHASFLDDVAAGQIKVCPMSRSDMVRATHLIVLCRFVNKTSLKSSDALVAVACRELALSSRARLTFYTQDWKLYRSLYESKAFRAALKLRFLGKGRGGIPPAAN